MEWLERFIEAKVHGVTKENIISGWRGAGLFPENMHRILIQLVDRAATPTTTPSPCTTRPAFYPNSCRPDPSSIHSINQAFLAEISNINLSTPYKTQVRRVCNFMEKYHTEAVMLKKELHEVKEINGRRKEKEGAKRIFLKGKPVLSTEEVEKALREAEKVTDAKKTTKNNNGKRTRSTTKKRVVSSEEEINSSTDDSSDLEEPLEAEVFDCIQVAQQKF